MTKDDIQLLYEYDRWANNRVLLAVAALSTEQFTRDLGGSFRSVRDTLLHIIAGEWGWLAYWKQPSDSSAFLADLRKRRDALFSPEAFPNVASVKLKWGEVEKEQAEFVNSVTDEALREMVPSHGTNQVDASDATFGEPLDLPSGSNRTDDATAWGRASGYGLPCVSGGRGP